VVIKWPPCHFITRSFACGKTSLVLVTAASMPQGKEQRAQS
jgi:hypothetical protein